LGVLFRGKAQRRNKERAEIVIRDMDALKTHSIKPSEMVLYLRPTDLPSNPADDYEVFDANRRSIGRIMLHPQALAGMPWFWTITARVPQYPNDRGYVATRDSTSRCHHITTRSRRPSPPILQNLIFGTHNRVLRQ
jgi:hypothetical protein